MASAFCEKKPGGYHHTGPMLSRFVLCVAPTGRWKIRVRNETNETLFVSVNVQTDQSNQPEARSARLSYLDDPHYLRFDVETDVMLDTYNYPINDRDGRYPSDGVRQDFDNNHVDSCGSRPNPGVVRRHGTMNAIAGFRTGAGHEYEPGSIVAGGYRLSDGQPAQYSSTGLGRKPYGPNVGLAAPLAAFPSDDSAAHLGGLAAGATDGSVRAMQGTSFSAVQMSRRVTQHLHENIHDPDFRVRSAIFHEAEAAEIRPRRYERFADPEKVGGGRLDARQRQRAPRL